MLLGTGDVLAVAGIAVAIVGSVGVPSFVYFRKRIDTITDNHLQHIDDKIDTLSKDVKAQHEAITEKVDALTRTMDKQLGQIEGWDLNNRVTNLERSNSGDGPYVRRRKHSR
jgi:hypothetical protein